MEFPSRRKKHYLCQDLVDQEMRNKQQKAAGSETRWSRVLPKDLGLHFIPVNQRGRLAADPADLRGAIASNF